MEPKLDEMKLDTAVVLGAPKSGTDVKDDLDVDEEVVLLKRSDEEVWNAKLVEEPDNVPSEEVAGGAKKNACVDVAELEPSVGLLPDLG